MTTHRPQEWRRSIGQGLVVAGVLLQVSVTLRSLTPDYLSLEDVRRILGIVMGIIGTVYASQAPKALSPLEGMRCNPTAEQALRRFAGWVLTLGGLGYTAAWLFAPIESAGAIAVSCLGSSLVIVISRLVMAATRMTRT